MYRFVGLLTVVISLCFCYEKDGKCYKSLNLIVALDASGSINIASWQSGINLAKQIIQSLAFADSGNKFAIIEFSTTAKVTHDLSFDSSAVINSLDNIKNQVKGGHTSIDAGLNEAMKIFDAANSNQKNTHNVQNNTQNVLITVTDGFMTYRNGQDIFDILKTPVEQLKAKTVELYAVRVGGIVKGRTLQFITTDPPSSHIFNSDQAGNLIEGIRKLTEAECPAIVCSTVKVSRVGKGCYKDNQQNERPLPYLTFTDRDQRNKKYSNVQLNWDNWGPYVRGLVCRCAEAVAKEKRYVFGLQYYGECWSSVANNTYAMDGVADDIAKCVSDTGKNCDSTMLYCVGTGLHNFVYSIMPRNV